MNMREKVQALQAKLSRAAKQSLDRRFGALYDKIYREDVLWVAWRRVRANRGAPGIDEQSIDYIEQEIGVERFLTELGEDLRAQRYRPKAVKRCWIEKPGKAEKRPLGIPVVRDRVCQMATKLVIEPIFETNFLKSSYGFRPKRSQHMAIRAIKGAIRNRKQTVVIDADIEKFFDRVDHSILLKLVQKRISDPRVLKLINGWLKAGVLDEGKYIEPEEIGTPQGAVISPLLSNVYLHSFDKMWEQSGIPGTMVRYADDVVILLWRYGDWTRRKVDGMLSRLKLRLHPEKTRVIKADDGFDFLGVHFRRRHTREKGHSYPYFCQTWPSDRSMERIRSRIHEKTCDRPQRSLEEVIGELNPTLRGWDQYHTRVRGSPERRKRLNGYVRERIRAFLKRKHNDAGRGWRYVPPGLHKQLGLYEFT